MIKRVQEEREIREICAKKGEEYTDDLVCMAVYDVKGIAGYCLFLLEGDFAIIKSVNCENKDADGLLRSVFNYALMHGSPFARPDSQEIQGLFHKYRYTDTDTDMVCIPELFSSGCCG